MPAIIRATMEIGYNCQLSHSRMECRVHCAPSLRAVDWQSAPFGKLQALPKDGRPVTSWNNQDEAFLDIARGIRSVAEELASNP